MSSAGFNALYRSYLSNRPEFEARFFKALTSRVMGVLRDEDAAQQFILGVWQAIPIEDPTHFAAWLGRRLLWAAKDEFRRVRNNREITAADLPESMDDNDEAYDRDDQLSILSFKHSTPQKEAFDINEIADPFIRSVAELIQEGHTQAEVAAQLKIKPSTLRSRLRRFRG